MVATEGGNDLTALIGQCLPNRFAVDSARRLAPRQSNNADSKPGSFILFQLPLQMTIAFPGHSETRVARLGVHGWNGGARKGQSGERGTGPMIMKKRGGTARVVVLISRPRNIRRNKLPRNALFFSYWYLRSPWEPAREEHKIKTGPVASRRLLATRKSNGRWRAGVRGTFREDIHRRRGCTDANAVVPDS